jgi:hypothetical protein
MQTRLLSVVIFTLVLGTAACAQDATPASPDPQANGAGGYGQRGGRGGFGGMGRGLMGAVTQVAADHYTIKTETGEIYTINFSVNTRIFRMPAGQRGPGGGPRGGMGGGQGRGGDQGTDRGGNPPEQIKPTDIKVGDVLTAMGEVDATAKSVGAVAIALVDPERAKQMQQMQANYGKTWIMGKVIAMDGVKVTLLGSIDNASHAFVADENTTFRKRREPITLADIQIGDMLRAEGALKDGVFTATTVNVIGMPPGGTPNIPRGAPPQ